MKFLNWLLYEVHRWLGVVLALFMFVWLFSGLVIMYAAPTTQTRAQQLAHAETLVLESGWLSLGEAWDRSAEQRKRSALERKPKTDAGHARVENKKTPAGEPPVNIAEARLLLRVGEPLWFIEDTHGMRFAVSAIDGSLREVNADQSLQIARNWFKTPENKLSYLETVESPVILRNHDTLRPFHRITTDDGAELLISARTGEVLHASTRIDRAFYWAGNWIHMFKPLESIGLGHIRHQVQLWSGLTAAIASLTGLIIGWLRWRPGFAGKRTYSEGRTQPYREFWFKWHFWSGLIGGSVVFFWAVSGFIETNPGQIFSQPNPSREESARYLGAELPETMRHWRPASLSSKTQAKDIVELGWRRLGHEAVLFAHTRDGQRLDQVIPDASQFSESSLSDATLRLAGDSGVKSREVLNDYDSYYYPRHHQGLTEKPLPVIRLQLSDEAGTLFYIDPKDGRLLAKLDRSRQTFRWVYSALHHWDFAWLYYHPLWNVWMLAWIAFGLVLGGTSLTIGWRRLKKTFAPKKSAQRSPPAGTRLATESIAD